MTNKPYIDIADLLIDIEAEMRQLLLWSDQRPADEAFTSDKPFCVDTLTFAEWLQFVFVERMQVISEQKLPLPDKCEISPMAEEYFRGHKHQPQKLIDLLSKMDKVITDG